MRTRELRAFVEGLRRIPLADQIVLELRFFEGLTARELADAQNIARGSVHRVVEVGIERLRNAIVAELSLGAGPADEPPPTAQGLQAWADGVRGHLES